jgi:2-polyprenyl-3-methyl-5-hydroxy-6-metoxy-1,4-benzoquinol methylase
MGTSEMQLGKEARHLYECCPLCESSNIGFIGEVDCRAHPLYNPKLPGTIRWKRCNECGHTFTDGYFTDEALDILYSKAHDYQLVTVENLEEARVVFAMIVDKISSVLGKQEGKWLDVGFGNGALLLTCAEYGFEPVGIDIREAAVEKIKPLGIEAYCKEFIDFEQFGTLTVISLADVLEHMPYPKKALDRAYKLLASGGLLFVSCPNADSLVWKSLTESKMNPYWHEIEHYHNFGRKRFYSLLTEHGFEPVNYGISTRYRIGMEVVSIKVPEPDE